MICEQHRMIWGSSSSRTSTHSQTELMSQRRDAPHSRGGVHSYPSISTTTFPPGELGDLAVLVHEVDVEEIRVLSGPGFVCRAMGGLVKQERVAGGYGATGEPYGTGHRRIGCPGQGTPDGSLYLGHTELKAEVNRGRCHSLDVRRESYRTRTF